MRQGIVIGAYHGNAEALDKLLKSLEGVRWPVVVVVSGAAGGPLEWIERLRAWRFERAPSEPGLATTYDRKLILNIEDSFELGAFDAILSLTDLDEWLFLQDTFEVLDQSFIDRVMAYDGPVALGPAMFHYAGKWRREIVMKMVMPTVRSKRESVHWEHTFSRTYLRLETKRLWVFDPHFHDGEHRGFVEAYGRKNMLLENDYYRKLKGDWGQRPL